MNLLTKQDKKEIKKRKSARDRLHHAVKYGILDKGERCFYCGIAGDLHGHHHNGYKEEQSLDVIWVCSSCHGKLHSTAKINMRDKTQGKCIVCGKPSRRLNLCETHRTRLRRYGSPYLKREKIGSDWKLVTEYYPVTIPQIKKQSSQNP